MNAARSVDPEACDRCGLQKATTHLEFAFSGPWNVCVDCRQKLIALHAKGGKRTANRSPGSRLWTPEDLAHKARGVA
jgi:hypothetical protein